MNSSNIYLCNIVTSSKANGDTSGNVLSNTLLSNAVWDKDSRTLTFLNASGSILYSCIIPPKQKSYLDWGIMTDIGDTSYSSPRGVFDMSSMSLVYGGGEASVMYVGGVDRVYYLRSGAYQTSNMSVSANTEYYLYREGESVSVDGDLNTTYLFQIAYTNSGAYSSYAIGTRIVVSGGKLKLLWGNSSSSVCYISVKEVS